MLEIDFYGNTTLSVIQMIVDRIERIKRKKIDISKIPLDDKKTYNLINRGNTAGVYQLGSKNKREFYKKFPVTSIENIIALMALYFQPASVQLAYHLNCKVSKANIEYEHPKMKPILEETYGIILFREQVVMLAQELAGFTIDEADVLLGDIRKKEIIALAIQKKKFIEGCKKHCYTEEKEENAIWHKLTKDGLYARKSYIPFDAILAYRAAFLKANYAVEFMDTIETYNKNTIIHGGSVMPPFSWTGSISV